LKHYLYIAIILILTFYSCNESPNKIQNNELSDDVKTKMNISFEIHPEDYENKSYSIVWYDTLGLSEGYLPENIIERPKEIKCMITNKDNDTLGYYKGSSMAQTYMYFNTNDSIINLNFMIGLNLIPKKIKTEKEKIDYLKKNIIPIKFKPIEINLNKDLSKKIEVELIQK